MGLHRAPTSGFPRRNPAGTRTWQTRQPTGSRQDERPAIASRQGRDAAYPNPLISGVNPSQAARVVWAFIGPLPQDFQSGMRQERVPNKSPIQRSPSRKTVHLNHCGSITLRAPSSAAATGLSRCAVLEAAFVVSKLIATRIFVTATLEIASQRAVDKALNL
jgi:hypothetical protein